jgi:cytochrome c553
MKNIIKSLSLIAALALSGNVFAAGNAAAGKAKSATCVACHGAAGCSATDIWPNLAGQKTGYLAKQLKDFKAGTRKDPSMTAMVAPLSDADIANLSAYYNSLPACK